MGKMGEELEKRLDENKYELYYACKGSQAFFSKTRQPNRTYERTELLEAYTEIVANINKALAKIEGGK